MKHLFTLSERLRAKWERFATFATFAMQSLKATKRQSDTTIFAKSLKSLKSLMSIFAESANSAKSAMSFFASRGVKDVRVSLGQYPTNIQLISNLSLTINRHFTRFAAVFALVFVLGVSNVWGTTFSYTDLSGQGSSGSGGTFTGATKDDITMGGKGNGNTSYVQIYANGTLTFTPLNGATITKIVLTATNNSYIKTWSASPGSVSVSGSKATWTGSSTSKVTLTNTATAQARITTMEVTYTAGTSGYSITYHCNGATSGCPSNASGQTKLPNTLSTPSKTGFSFGGWYTNVDLTTAATEGATLSGNADLYAKWTCNVTLNRNGATEVINNVVEGATLDNIDGTGLQGGCSAWEFVGWSKSQRAAQDNTSAMSLVTTVDGSGPYYAVYSHTESGGENTASSNNLSSTSTSTQTVETGKPITYKCSSSNTYSNPARIYKNGTFTIAGGTITHISLTGVADYAISNMTVNTGSLSTSGNNGTWTGSAASVVFTASTGQARVSAISVTYTGGSTTYYSTTATCCTALGQINGTINLTQLTEGVNAGKLQASWPLQTTTAGWAAPGIVIKIYEDGNNTPVVTSDALANNTTSFPATSFTPKTCTQYYATLTATHGSDASYCAGDLVSDPSAKVTTAGYTYGISKTNVSLKAGADEEVSTCDGNFSAQYEAAAGYALPTTLTVSGASAHTWSVSEGVGTLSISAANVTGNVSTTIAGTCIEPVVTGPVDAEYYVGDAPTALSVSATLASGTLTYLWKVSTNNGETWSDAAGTNNEATYSGASLSTASDGTLKFKCIVGNSEGGCSVESAVATITVSIASYFQNNKTLFIEAGASGSAWDTEACVKAWFRDGNEGGEAVATQWLANSGDGKKIFATVIPSTGDYRYMTLQRFGDNCNGFYNDNGSVSKADDGGSNVVKTTCSSTECVSWSPSALSLYLRGDIDNWEGNLATLSDQNAGIWTATISNHDATATSHEFRIADSYSNLHGNGNTTLSGMTIGSTYNITATYNVKTGTLTMSKTFVKGTVHFDLQGHGLAIADIENVTAGSKISAPSAPSATGWDFGGWFTDADCTEGNEWTFASDEVNETMTLYAKWTKQNYTITKTFTNCTSSAMPTNYEYTGTANDFSYTIAAADGYRLPDAITVTMGGAALTLNTEYTWNSASGALAISKIITGNIVITATAVQAYTITWSANGAETTSTVDAGNKLVLPEDDPATCNGTYGTFIGWYSVAAGSTSNPSNAVSGTKADANHTPEGNETFYAVWGNGALSGDFSLVTNVSQLHEGDVVTIASVKGNSQNGSVIKAYNSGNNWPKASVTTNASGNIPANTTDMRTFTLAEGTVDGTWAFYDGTGYIYAANSSNGNKNYMKRKTTLDAAGSFTVSIDGTSSAVTAESKGDVNGKKYIRWNSSDNIFSCYGSGQNDIYLYKQASAATGFISNCCNSLDAFNGAVSWSNPTTAVLTWDNVAHVSSWAVKYKKHVDGSYSDFADAITGEDNKTCTISSLVCGTDYDFQIIATADDGYCDKSQTINDTQAHKYAITLDPANGEVKGGSFAASESACNGDNVDLLAEAATGYTFNGWTITKASSGNVSPAANIAETTFEMPAEAVTVSAAFSLANYTITYANMEGATNHVSNPATYNVNSSAITLGAPTKEGYDFGGWFTNSDLAPEHVVGTPAIAAGSTGNKTFYAKWTQTGTHIVTISDYSNGLVSVTYTGMESALTSDSRTIEENTVLTITATPNTGYDVLMTVGGEDFTSGNTHTLVADITIVALFEPKTYTITYKDQSGADYSGSNLASLPTSHTYNTATALVDGVKAGHSFGGWFTDAACTESAGSSLGATAYTDNITLYAKWEEVTMYSVTWMVNGAAYAAGTPTTSVEAGDAISNLPTAPEVCDEDLTFMGWTNAAIEGTQVAAPAVLFTTAGAAPAVTGNVTFHAVFAEASQFTATFNAANISNLTENYTNNWTHTATGIVFYISGGQRYTKNEPYTFTVSKNSNCGLTSPDGVTIKKAVLTLSNADYPAASVTPGSLATSGTTQTITSVNAEYLYIYATKTAQIRITNIDVKYTSASPTYSNYRTLYDASVPTPTLDVASGKYTSSQVVLIENHSDDYMYFYTTDGSTPAADANLDPISPAVAYDSNDGIEITETSTVKVIAYDLCHNASEVTTATYTIAESLTLAEFVEQKPTTNEKVDLTGAIVMANDAEYGYIYVQKDEAAMALYYDDEVPSWTVGKQIANGVITGHYDAEDLSMIVTNAGSPTASADGVLPTPLVITDDNAETLMVEANMYRYAQINSVTLDEDEYDYLNAYSTTSDNSYYYEDQFHVLGTLPLTTTECSVKGIINPYSVDDVYYFEQLSPILTNDISTNATAILPTISDLGGADAENAVEVAEGKEITITEDANFDAIYQINDGAETAINTSAVVTITNTAAATKVYVKASRDYYADNTITYYYIANSALTEHTITCATGLAGGSIGADKSAAVTGATVTLTPTPAEHHHWVSWTVTYNDGEEKTIDVVNNQFTMPGYNVNVTAAFAEDAFATVSFAKGDEAVTGDVPASQKIYLGEGAHVTMPANPFTYAGHNFAGWKYNETTKQPSETYAITTAGAITFTAQWIANPICTVTLHANGAEDVVEEVVQGATYNMPDAGALVGYTFVGWADAVHNDETTDAIDVVSSFTPEVQAVASTKEFYAVYRRQEGENQYVKVTSDLGTAWAGDYLIANSSTIFADGRKGGKDNAGEIGKADVKVDLSTHIVDNTIAAEYGDPYKVTLEEISANSNTYVLKTQDGKYNYQTAIDNGLVASTNKTTASAYPITVTFTSENDVKLVLGGDAAGVAFRYNASYRIFRYYKNAGQNAVYLYKYISGTTYYTTNPTVKYNVSYELGGGAWRANEGCDASVVEAGTVYNEVCEYEPVLANKAFDKWQVNDADIELPYTINANTTFTAVYRDAVQYAVNYDANGGVGSAPAATNVLEAADYTVLANTWFFRSGHTFQGWNTAADGSGASYAADAVMAMPSENVTLYAQWQVMPANEKEVVIVAKVGDNYYAMGQTLSTKQFNAIAVAGVRDNKVILPDGFSDANKTAITWHMITNNNGATAAFYSPANSKYLAGGNDLSLSSDPVDWTWSSENQCYVIGGRTFMYRSSNNFRSYSTSNLGSSGYAEAMYVTTEFAKAITEAEATEAGLSLGDNIVVQDGATLTIGSQQFINDVVVENGGNLTLNANLSIHDLVIHSTLGKGTGTGSGSGNTNAPGNCGQVINGNNITVTGDVYLELELTQDAAASAGWYAFSVPFPVDAMNGVYYGDTKLQNEVGYAIMSHYGDLRAKNEYAWKKFRGIMQPGVFYVITVGNTDYKTLRFKKVKDEALVASSSVAVSQFPTQTGNDADGAWNGIGNPNLQISNLATSVPVMQFYDHKSNSFIGRDHSVNLVVGSAFFIQYSATSSVSIPTTINNGHGYLAPQRERNAVEETIYEVQLTNMMTDELEDNVFLSAREDATNEYEIGHDVAKLSMGTAKCAQMWVPAYGTQLCAADFQLVNDKAIYPLSINTPKDGTYFISAVENENATIYLTYNGKSIWNLSMSACEVELTKGLNESYGLKLVVKAPQTPTGIESISDEGLEIRGAQKIVLDDHVYILRGGKMYDVTGKMVR